MKKTGLLALAVCSLLALGTLMHSCSKKNNVLRLSYAIDSLPQNVYVGDTGYTNWPVKFAFLYGNPLEAMTIQVTGMPLRLSVTPDSVTAVPTFIENFQFHGNYAALGSYPATLQIYSPTTGTRVFNFNLVVVTANCGFPLAGNYSGSNACTSANYSYSSIITANGGNTINIQNLGGYGSNSNVTATVNCNTDSVMIAKQADGNGDTLVGVGTFTANQLVIYYKKTTQVAGSDSCVATLNRQ
jgi:hypothetical protein